MRKHLEYLKTDDCEYYISEKMALDICMHDMKTYFNEIVNVLLWKKKMTDDDLFFCIDKVGYQLGLAIPEDSRFAVIFKDVQNDDIIDREVW
jgi:hypothetical protein